MRDLQQVILNIFVEIDKLCRKHGIPYYAIGGTCIGAVRHKGFVPWDDDMDIAIPVEYFDKFKSIAQQELPDHLEVISGDNREHYCQIALKISDSRTTFINEAWLRYSDEHKGVFVDIAPLAGVPKNPMLQWLYKTRIHMYCDLNFAQHRDLDQCGGSFRSRLLWHIVRALPLPVDFFSRRWIKLIKRHPCSKAALVGYVWNHKISKVVCPRDWFGEPVNLPFENTVISCPNKWDDYLTLQFGDYMTIPPEDKHETHMQDGILDLNRSYRLYSEEITRVGWEEFYRKMELSS